MSPDPRCGTGGGETESATVSGQTTITNEYDGQEVPEEKGMG